MTGKKFYLIAILLFAAPLVFAQKKETITTSSVIDAKSVRKKCVDLRLGKALTLPSPKYPSEAKSARAGGTIEITVEIDENGDVLRAEKITGGKLFQGAAIVAAMKSKFAATLCDGVKTRVSGVITYVFLPNALQESYSTVARVEEFADVKSEAAFYPAILDLTENYHLAFGYADGNFHADAALTRGDFAHFLRLTLDMLSTRAKFANKDLRSLKTFSAFNPQKIKFIENIKDVNSNAPYFESIKILLQNYDIAIIDGNSEFRGKAALTLNEVIDLWTQIFGEETVPVNFKKTENFERRISRGDFALFLQESLGVLTYKLLP
ncbi:MAG TPA: TonB family protein [Pyrinomonadaceae bacterium]|jgi:TonB family protein